MDGSGSNPLVATARVEHNRKKDVGCLRTAVGNPRIVRSALEGGVFEIDVSEAVPRRCEINQPSSCPEKRRNPVHQYEMAEVIRAELRFESILSMTEWCRYDTSIAMITSNGSPFFSNASAHALTLVRLARSSAMTSKLPPLSAASFLT
jgi:hypothetical protein